MPIVQLSASARADLEEIYSYIAGDNAGAADKITLEMLEKFRLLAGNSMLGRARHELMVNLRSFSHRRYIIFYFPIDDGIEIFRVLHGSRDIDSLFDETIESLPPALDE
ncbi:MAG: type II toxin-antitoxin system RelE/ParE family toxin [Pyrinomonadaceae bacterium]